MALAYSIGADEAVSAIAPPNPPSSLSFTNITSSGITANWSDDSADELGFYVYVSNTNTKPAVTYTTAADAESYPCSGLTAATLYYFWIEAENAGGSSAAISGTCSTYQTTPTAPTNLTFSLVSTSGFTVGWTDTSATESGFYVYVGPSGTLPGSPTYTTNPNATSQVVTGLDDDTLYYVWVYAFITTGQSTPISGTQQTEIAPTAPLLYSGNYGAWINNGKQVCFSSSGTPAFTNNCIGKFALDIVSGYLYFGTSDAWNYLPTSQTLSIHINNNAAVSGGVPNGAFYMTPSGVLMVRY